jgi:hypothetical protein
VKRKVVRKVVVQARPVQVPRWWPKSPKTKQPLWASCDRDGGYTMGFDRLAAVAQGNVAGLKKDWLVDHAGRDWQFRTRAIPRKKR